MTIAVNIKAIKVVHMTYEGMLYVRNRLEYKVKMLTFKSLFKSDFRESDSACMICE